MRDEEMSLPAVSSMAGELGADVFISTWSSRGAKTSGVVNRHQAARMFGSIFEQVMPRSLIGGSRLLQIFPDLEELLDDRSPVEAGALLQWFPGAAIDIEDDSVLHLGFSEPVEDSNSLRMLYKLWRCNQMKVRRERDNGRRYDVVVRLRPDVVPHLTPEMLEFVSADESGRRYFLPEGRMRADYLNDVAAASGSEAADHYASLFGAAVLSPGRRWRLIHHELSEHLERRGAEIHELPLRQHITSAWSLRQPRNRQVFLAEFERNGRTRLPFSESDQALLLRLLKAADALESEQTASQARSLMNDASLASENPEVLYSVAIAFALLSGAERDSVGSAFWWNACALAAGLTPLSPHDMEDRVEAWVHLAGRAGPGFRPEILFDGAGPLAGLRPEVAGSAEFLKALRRCSPDFERYRALMTLFAARLS